MILVLSLKIMLIVLVGLLELIRVVSRSFSYSHVKWAILTGSKRNIAQTEQRICEFLTHQKDMMIHVVLVQSLLFPLDMSVQTRIAGSVVTENFLP